MASIFRKKEKKISLSHEALLAWVGIILTFLTIAIMIKQNDISELQAEISKKQTEIQSDQIETTTRPYVEITQKTDEIDTLVIRNLGKFPITNIRFSFLRFCYIENHGWHSMIPGEGIVEPSRKTLLPSELWNLNLDSLTKGLKKTFVENVNIKPASEHLIILVSFQRRIDGKRFLTILPNRIIEINGKKILFPDSPQMGYSGSIKRLCSEGMELTMQYFRIRPYFNDYELYNTNYLLGYQFPGCLGEVDWKD